MNLIKFRQLEVIERAPLLEENGIFIAHVAGTIDRKEKERLNKLLFRATRGKVLTFFKDFIG